MKKILLCLLSIFLLFSCAKNNAEKEEPLLILRYGDNQPDYYPTTRAARYFSQLVEESGDFDMAAAYTSTCRLLQRRQDFTALFVISDSMAVAAMKALHDCGRRVPEDCSVIAIDGIEMSDYTVPTLTTLIQPKEAMGAEAVGILVDAKNLVLTDKKE